MNNIIKKDLIIGEEWLYYKIYTGTNTSDKILSEIIKPVTEDLIQDNIIDKWFFIRYTDPKHHIRFRVHIPNSNNIGLVINKMLFRLREFVEQGLVWNIQVDTYKREISRYGIGTMLLSEDLFYNDSKMIVEFLNLIGGDEGEELRWLFSLKAIDSFLNTFQYSAENKLILFKNLKTSYGQEFGMNQLLKNQLDAKFRYERKKIENFLKFNKDEDIMKYSVLNILKIKSKVDAPKILEILKIHKAGELDIKLDFLVSSYIHMFMNRLFKSKNRMHEMVCYDFLYRHYRSHLAQMKIIKNTSIDNS